jgi:hypothetical protein
LPVHQEFPFGHEELAFDPAAPPQIRPEALDSVYFYQAIPDDDSRRFFDMEAELESLPTQRQYTNPN